MKNSKKGISLIVLIITIIVIVILATAILVSVISNNPISEANKARYESDRDNMQAVFTNTVGKIMVENQGVVNVTAGQINTETTGVNETTGEVAYTVDNAMVASNASGKIVFDKGTNNATTYYTGKKLPIYAAGETKWYVDSEGVLSLEVAGVKYGSGEEVITYTSLGNYQHEATDGSIESHDTENGTCSLCGENVLAAGLYAEDGTMAYSWDDLLSNIHDYYCEVCGETHENISILTIDSNGVLLGNSCDKESPPSIATDFLNGKLVIKNDDSVTHIGDYAFFGCQNLTSILIPNNITTIGEFAFKFGGLTSISIPNSVTSIGSSAFETCVNLTSINIPNGVTSIEAGLCMMCQSLEYVVISDGVTSIGSGAFMYANLKELTIPNSVTKIDNYVFTSCPITVINYIATQEQWHDITFDEYWNAYCSEITVHCTDGDIIIPAWTE